jgi:hypothetical protein
MARSGITIAINNGRIDSREDFMSLGPDPNTIQWLCICKWMPSPQS